jgi:hypothetical protein
MLTFQIVGFVGTALFLAALISGRTPTATR